ncbi:hypothetical protein CkaCkLH20_10368 [Colletotrichum karsti]|uniref:EGF-like domain-containing protein n=1 Tax=Colletotrichum karsti TaxID=1095194 RepID=A0A9P6I103_9PEZI|nr:uncharacterized protein CkaCkLH20_10368 [Colletotrichum karsti]KAF9872031.1 hypothetical protein CkaCkLH20_10368 [Colletotrichum karsti]
MRLLIILVWVFGLSTSHACQTDEDCSLNGICVPNPKTIQHSTTAKACECDPGWVGDSCGVLDLAPATRYSGYNHTNFTKPDDFGPYGNSSWGGRILQDPKNASVFHLFTSQFGKGCGLSGWRPHSHIIRAESYTGPQGPYHWAQDVTTSTGFRHNPDVVFSPVDRKYLMYSIGVEAPEFTECKSFTYKDWPNNISVASADNIRGPWTDWKVIVDSDFNKDLPVRATNPSPFPLWTPDNPTSDIALLIKDYNIYTASAWNTTYEQVHEASWVTAAENDTPYWTEDPFIWRDKRGNWHSLNHWMIDLVEFNAQQWPRVGSHLFARNLTGPWHFPLKTAFTSNVTYEDGSWELLRRRERPKLYFSNDGEMTPMYLVTGVQDTFDGSGRSFTHIQPIGTKWRDFEKAIWP